jgi:hypothetical protein
LFRSPTGATPRQLDIAALSLFVCETVRLINCVDAIDNYLTVIGPNVSDKEEFVMKKLIIPFSKDEKAGRFIAIMERGIDQSSQTPR